MAFTYFMRDLQTLELAAKHVIPYTAGRSHVRVWDAGCAMGQEAYTMAIVFAESMGNFAFQNLRLHATDLDNSDLFGEIIGSGIYPEEELQRMPQDLFKKYFQPAAKPNHFQVVDKLRSRIQYQKHDLLSLKAAGDGYSLIVCKNVLLHFQASERVEVIKMYHRSLALGGFFPTEQTQKMPPELTPLFEQVTADAQLFRKVEAQG